MVCLPVYKVYDIVGIPFDVSEREALEGLKQLKPCVIDDNGERKALIRSIGHKDKSFTVVIDNDAIPIWNKIDVFAIN